MPISPSPPRPARRCISCAPTSRRDGGDRHRQCERPHRRPTTAPAMDMLGICSSPAIARTSPAAARVPARRLLLGNRRCSSHRGVVDPSCGEDRAGDPGVLRRAGCKDFFVPDAVSHRDSHLPRALSEDQRHHAVGLALGHSQHDHRRRLIQRLIVMLLGAPQPSTLRRGVNVDRLRRGGEGLRLRAAMAAGPTPKVAQTALTVRPEVVTFLRHYMKNLPSSVQCLTRRASRRWAATDWLGWPHGSRRAHRSQVCATCPRIAVKHAQAAYACLRWRSSPRG